VGGPALHKPAHLLRARGCALAVDTLSYNSHTTGADALWSGAPTRVQGAG
jgi:predicted O-linked N-acetylglucosamine transferase (SPINDLY family)